MTRRFKDRRLLISTHNSEKLAEISSLLESFDVSVVSAASLNLDEPVEDGASFVENARIKAHAGCRATGLITLADDSGVEIDALDGAPGIYTADWATTDHGRDFLVAMDKTHKRLLETGRAAPWTARFKCTLVMAWPDGHDETFEGSAEGSIVWPMRGNLGHGYDPVFQPRGYDITFGEMCTVTKNRISHRADAFNRLIAGCFA